MKSDFEIYIRPSRYDPFNPDNPKTVKKYAKAIFYEYQKIIFYKITKLLSIGYPQLR